MVYQERDWEIVDYQMYSLKDTGKSFRGPEPKTLEKNQYFVCIGAAQTFGCFCKRPYPILLEEQLNLPALNLSAAGAGPDYFLQEQDLIPYINNARFAIVQVMSGRSESNSVFSFNSKDGAGLTRRADGVKIGADPAYQELLKENEPDYVKKIVAETRENWVNNFQELLKKITIPKILLWFSNRRPYYQEKYNHVYQLFNGFPQLVNLDMVKQIRKYSDKYVECISNRGRHQLLISRFTDKPATIDDLGLQLNSTKQSYNKYYPSPEMHVDASLLLEKVCKKYL